MRVAARHEVEERQRGQPHHRGDQQDRDPQPPRDRARRHQRRDGRAGHDRRDGAHVGTSRPHASVKASAPPPSAKPHTRARVEAVASAPPSRAGRPRRGRSRARSRRRRSASRAPGSGRAASGAPARTRARGRPRAGRRRPRRGPRAPAATGAGGRWPARAAAAARHDHALEQGGWRERAPSAGHARQPHRGQQQHAARQQRSRRAAATRPAIATAPISPSQITAHGAAEVGEPVAQLRARPASRRAPRSPSRTSRPARRARRSSTVGATSVELTTPSVRVESEYSVVPPGRPAAPVATRRRVMWLGSWITSTVGAAATRREQRAQLPATGRPRRQLHDQQVGAAQGARASRRPAPAPPARALDPALPVGRHRRLAVAGGARAGVADMSRRPPHGGASRPGTMSAGAPAARR